jgi:hypothetical protein
MRHPPPLPEISWKSKYKMRNLTDCRNSNGAVMVVLIALAISANLT